MRTEKTHDAFVPDIVPSATEHVAFGDEEVAAVEEGVADASAHDAATEPMSLSGR
jgi:hypothetical protein